MPIDVAFTAAIIKGPEHKIVKSGKPYIWMLCRDGHGEQAQLISVMVFGESVDAMPAVGQGDKVYVEGTISLNEWTAAGGREKAQPVGFVVARRTAADRQTSGTAPKKPAQHGTHAPLPPDFKDPDGCRREIESERRYA